MSKTASTLACAVIVATALAFDGQVDVGILHSETGTMAISEASVILAEKLAIKQINDAGGVLGKEIVPVVRDGASDWPTFKQEAEYLTKTRGLSTVFGCWTSASRKEVMSVFEDNNKLLFYPLQYEGQECSKNVFYFGATPNQQLTPAVDWLLYEGHRNFYLAGSDYVFPQTANAIMGNHLKIKGGHVANVSYIALGEKGQLVNDLVDNILSTMPDGGVILNTLNGDSNVAFFTALNASGMGAEKYPVMSFSVGEPEVAAIGTDLLEGHLATWTYFQSISSDENAQFIADIREEAGDSNYPTADPMAAAYTMVFAWKQMVECAGTFDDVDALRSCAYGVTVNGPQGKTTMLASHHTSKAVRVGKVNSGGQFDIEWSSESDVYPSPWNAFVSGNERFCCDWNDPSKGMKTKLPTAAVGILHSSTGTMAVSERTVIDSELLAIEEINNQAGCSYEGLNGKIIVPVFEDGASDADTFAQKATELLTASPVQNDTKTLFACWTSASRKAVLPIVEQYNALLYYPVQYEAQECSKNIFYGGATPNQQLEPAVHWLLQQYPEKKYFFVGSDYVYPRTAGEIAKSYITTFGREVVAERYIALGDSNVTAIMNEIEEKLPTGGIIINTLNGGSNAAFFSELSIRGLNHEDWIIMSFSVDEPTALAVGSEYTSGTYGSWNYFNSLENNAFKAAFQARYSDVALTSDPMEASYLLVHMWAKAVKQVSSFEVDVVRSAMYGIEADVPHGKVQMTNAHHMSKKTYIGKLDLDGQYTIMFETAKEIKPEPWSRYVESTVGMGCDWSTDQKGGKYQRDIIKVGILHSLSGTMGLSERTVVHAELMAIDEINEQGGLLGKEVFPVIKNGASDWDLFYTHAETLVGDPEITATFGCWTSSSRKKVAPVFEKANKQLFYPLQYEGQECSKNIFYTGATPNQQIEPAVDWAMRNLNKKIFLMGSDYVFPRTAAEITQAYIGTYGGEYAGDGFVALGDATDASLDPIVADIKSKLPDGGVILNALNGDQNIRMFQKLAEAGLTPDKWPTLSFSITEHEIKSIGISNVEGHYAAWNYFTTIENAENEKFKASIKARLGDDAVTNDPMEAAYIMVKIWAKAVAASGTTNTDDVRSAAYGISLAAPEGTVTMNENHHLSKIVRIGKVRSDGLFDIVFARNEATPPLPWNQFVKETVGRMCDHSDPNKGQSYKIETVKVGILHSLTGTMSGSERSVVDAELLAIQQINEAGGVLGKHIVPVVRDGKSDWPTFEQEAKYLTTDPDLEVVFGCWTSASRKQVKWVFETSNKMLFYPLQYEGQECSKNIAYFGAAPNQQLEVAVDFMKRSHGNDFFLVGSDYVFPRTANSVIKEMLRSTGGIVHGEEYIPLGGTAVTTLVNKIMQTMPNGGVILNTLNGDSNVAFFHQFYKSVCLKFTDCSKISEVYPIMSLSIGEVENEQIGLQYTEGHYSTWNYYQSISSEANAAFLSAIYNEYGASTLVTDPMESAYIMVHMWKLAAEKAKSFEAQAIREGMYGMTFDAPQGQVQFNENNHLSKWIRVGRAKSDGQFDILFETKGAVKPQPWSQRLPDNYGDTCDWSSDGGGEQFKVDTVKVGILHSFTGTMAISEQSVVDAVQFAFTEINEAGGLLGKRIIPVTANGASDWPTFATEAQNLIDGGVDHIFGCWTSASRVEVKPVVESANALLFYPVQYEAQECSKNIFYGGAAPNQQLLPGLNYGMRLAKTLGDKFFLVGSDYVYPRTANKIAKSYLQQNGIEVCAKCEKYIQLGSTYVDAVINSILTEMPDGGVIVNTLNGDTNVAFFRRMKLRGLLPSKYPVMSMSIGEAEIAAVGLENLVGHWASWNYFESINSEINDAWKTKIKGRIGSNIRLTDPMEAAYSLVNLWKQAVVKAGSFDVDKVRAAMYGLSFNAPGGRVTMNENHHLSKKIRVGKINAEGQFDIAFERANAVSPEPWSSYISETKGGSCDWSDAINKGEFFKQDVIEVGLLHSVTGTMAISERTLLQAERLAIEEINARGGLLGRKIVSVFKDGASEASVFASKAQEFIDDSSIAAVMGCWTSASRKAVKQLFEAGNKLLYYPLQYEGQECSKNIFYSGATPNQQIEPAVDWALRNLGSDFFLVGSDYVFPRTANEIIKAYAGTFGGTIYGEMYAALGDSSDATLDAIIASIETNMPNGGIVLNSLNGDQNVQVFRKLRALEIKHGYKSGDELKWKVVSFSITETEIEVIGKQYAEGSYAAWNYFHTLGTSSVNNFIAKFKDLNGGEDVLTNDPMESAYIMVHLWAKAVEKAQSLDTDKVREAMYGLWFDAPEGRVTMQTNHHITKQFALGKVNADGLFDIMYKQDIFTKPKPWNQFVASSALKACDWSNSSRGEKYSIDALSIGLLHSFSGHMASSERTVYDMELLAIEEINAAGGLMGKTLVPVIKDGKSTPSIFQQKMEEFEKDSSISHVFGCWTSDSRKAVLGTLKRAEMQLYYPLQYEGQECEENVFYGGATPNQQIIPAVDYLVSLGHKKFYLLGSDYVFPTTANSIIKSYINENLLGTIVGEEYITMGSVIVDGAIDRILQALPEGGAILSTLNGNVNKNFFMALKAKGMEADKYPVMSFSVAEEEVRTIGAEYLMDHLASWNYFQTIQSSRNKAFVASVKRRFGGHRVVNDPMESAYILINMWADAVRSSNSLDVGTIRSAMHGATYDAAQGLVTMNSNNHLSQTVRIGRVRQDGLFTIVFALDTPALPSPWSQNHLDSKGYACSHANNLLGKKYKFDSIKVGILHSKTGTMSLSEQSLIQAEMLAIEEINSAGGVLGKRIVPVLRDGQSDATQFGIEAEDLASSADIAVIFGVWTSAARKVVKDVVEKHSKLLFYPLQYEGMECSSNVIYTGQTPNQQIEPALEWAMDNLGSTFYCVGSDYVFPRTANSIVKSYADSFGMTVAGEKYVALGDSTDASLDPIVQDIMDKLPNGGVILNTLNGDQNVRFFQKLRENGITADKWPSISFSVTETEINGIGVDNMLGHYAAWSFFMPNECNLIVSAKQDAMAKLSELVDAMEVLSAYAHLIAFGETPETWAALFADASNVIEDRWEGVITDALFKSETAPLEENRTSLLGLFDSLKTLAMYGDNSKLSSNFQARLSESNFEGQVNAMTASLASVYKGHDGEQNEECPADVAATEDALRFVNKFRGRYGNDHLVTDPMESSYVMIHLWAQAVESAGSFDTDAVRSYAHGLSVYSPQGLVSLKGNNHLMKHNKIGKVNKYGRFDVVFSRGVIDPKPWNRWVEPGFACNHRDAADGDSQHGHRRVEDVANARLLMEDGSMSNLDKRGEKFELASKTIHLAYDVSGGAQSGGSVPMLRSALMAVDEINANGGVGGFHIITNMKGGDDANTVAVFGGNPVDFSGASANALFKQARDDGIFAMATAKYFDDSSKECVETSIEAGTSYNSMVAGIVAWAHSRSLHDFAIVCNSDFDASTIVAAVTATAGHTYKVIRLTESNRQTIANEILAHSGSKSTAVINMLWKTADVESFVRSVSVAGWMHQSKPILFLSLTDAARKTVGYEALQSYYIADTFWSGDRTRAQSASFSDKFYDRFSSDTLITGDAAATYSSIHQWAEAVNAIGGDFSETNVRRKLYSQIHNAPSSNVRLGTFNTMSRPLIIMSVQIGRLRSVFKYDGGEFIPSSCESRFAVRPCASSDYDFTVSKCVDSTAFREVRFYQVNTSDTNICKGGASMPADELSTVPCDYVPLSSSFGIIMTILCVIWAAVSVFFALWVTANKKEEAVKASQPMFLRIISYGCILLSVVPLLFLLSRDSAFACMIKFWVLHLVLTLILACFCVKTYRVYKIFENASLKKVKLSDHKLMVGVFTVCMVTAAALAVWTVIDPSTPAISLEDFGTHIVGVERQVCATENGTWFVVLVLIEGTIAMLTLYMSYQIRAVPLKYSESKHMFSCLSQIVFLVGIVLLVSYGTELSLSVESFMYTLAILGSVSLIFAWIFVPKLLAVREAQMLERLGFGKDYFDDARGFIFEDESTSQRGSKGSGSQLGSGSSSAVLLSLKSKEVQINALRRRVIDLERELVKARGGGSALGGKQSSVRPAH